MTRIRHISFVFNMVLIVGVGACARPSQDQSASNEIVIQQSIEPLGNSEDRANASANRLVPPTQKWIGRWNGPEGLFLDIRAAADGKPGHYALINRDSLDRQGDFSGVADGTTIRFVRDGKDLTIRPGSGAETGFKYLAGKTDCLIVVPGQEGYCR